MSKVIYWGGGTSRKVKRVYLGIDGVSHKVKKGYIGDESGKARLFYSSGRIWKKYNTVTTNTYYWDMYTVTKTTTYSWDKYNVITVYNKMTISGNGKVNTGNVYYYTYTLLPNIAINGTLFTGLNSRYSSADPVLNCYIGTTSSPSTIYWVTSATRIDSGRIEYDYTHRAVITENASKGSFIETVTSTNSSAYPDDGVDSNGDYYYVATGSEIEYSKGSYVGKMPSTNRNQYPDNNYSGNYWYVYHHMNTTYSQGSYIGIVENDDPNAYPDNGRHTDGYWYAKQNE